MLHQATAGTTNQLLPWAVLPLKVGNEERKCLVQLWQADLFGLDGLRRHSLAIDFASGVCTRSSCETPVVSILPDISQIERLQEQEDQHSCTWYEALYIADLYNQGEEGVQKYYNGDLYLKADVPPAHDLKKWLANHPLMQGRNGAPNTCVHKRFLDPSEIKYNRKEHCPAWMRTPAGEQRLANVVAQLVSEQPRVLRIPHNQTVIIQCTTKVHGSHVSVKYNRPLLPATMWP
eukprot:TRINITY_DN18136_c0_g1_i1.p1 TRINITY_DN18136_c0_g1~~TRINITY_DN18136_c0_g1_i1.p1  ORF type:complete len:233 (+),score=14.90 TRINITY_DN18136_c0_g1_i1:198-896(+)